MSFSMAKLRALLPGQNAATSARHSVALEPEIGFQINIEETPLQATTNGASDGTAAAYSQRGVAAAVPELNVHLIAARHLPTLFGFKIVQGYLIKVKLFPGSKRIDSSVQTNSWPKFNENFKFPLAPDIKPSLKHSARRGSKVVSDFTPEALIAGQFVVFTVYALLELPPASFNRFNKTYRSLRDKSSNLVQKVVESSSGKSKDDKENSNFNKQNESSVQKPSARDAMPPLTISESRRNIGSVTIYLEPKLFKRNARTGLYSTEELWLPIKDITTTMPTGPNNLANSAKGVVEIALEVRDLNVESGEDEASEAAMKTRMSNGSIGATMTTAAATTKVKNPQWNRMTSEMKRKMGLSNVSSKAHDLVLRVTTARMRCSNKVKDELEANAGSVYVKTTVYEHGIYVDSWKSPLFFASLSTKWDVGGDVATLNIPLQSLDSLNHIHLRTTLATKTKMNKKLVLGTVIVGAAAAGSGSEHMLALAEAPFNERIAMWHSFQ